MYHKDVNVNFFLNTFMIILIKQYSVIWCHFLQGVPIIITIIIVAVVII